MRLLSSLILLAAPALLAAQLPYSHPELGFAMRLPDGFLAEGVDPLANPATVACFVKPGEGEHAWARLCVEKMNGTLPRDRMSGSDLPAGATEVPFSWKGFDLQGIRVDREDERLGAVTTWVVLVPLRTAAVRLVAAAPRASAAEAQAAVVTTLATLEGQTNWLSSTERAERAGSSVGQIGVLLIAIGTGMWIGKRRRAKA